MNWIKKHSLENVVTTSYDSFDKALSLGLVIYYDQESELQILTTDSFDKICDNLEKGSSYYEVFGNSILFKFRNVLKRLELEGCSFETICATEEDNISLLNLDFCKGSTSKRKPRIRRNEIISTANNNVVYRWNDDKVLIFCDSGKYLFQTKFKGDLYLIDLQEDFKIWSTLIDEGIPGRRYYQKVNNDSLLVQKYFSVDNNNLIKIDLATGAIIWEVQNTLSYYNYDESNCQLYGIGGKTFEIINADTGVREIQKELSENLHISSHLSHYDNGLLYFSAYRENNIPVFGAVNVEDGELIFTQEVEIPGEKSFRKGLDKPIVIGNRLYVRDSMKTLHVFEKNEITEPQYF